MNYTAQVIYSDFVEKFNVDIDNGEVTIKLKEISDESSVDTKLLTLDLSREIKSAYSIFPYEDNDLTIIQVKDVFIVVYHTQGEIQWFKFEASELIEYLLDNDITAKIIPFMSEDKHILLNAVLSDCIRNDYSYSDLNKKVKFVKVAILLSFVKSHLQYDFARVILDETVLGDIEVDQIAMAFRFAQTAFLKLAKIDNVTKILTLLEKKDIIDQPIKFVESAYFINNPNNGNKVKLLFGESGVKFDYAVLPSKNYVFDLGEKSYTMNVGNLFKEQVSGKVFVFNGDERDLLIH